MMNPMLQQYLHSSQASNRQQITAAGNKPIILDRQFSDRVLLIESGHLDLFAAGKTSAGDEGKRHHVARFESGQLIFCPDSSRNHDLIWIAAGNLKTEIMVFSRTEFLKWLSDKDQADARRHILGEWSVKMAGGMNFDLPAKVTAMVDPDRSEQVVKLLEGETARSSMPCWCKVVEGSVDWLEHIEVAAGNSFLFPDCSWIKSKARTELRPCSLEQPIAAPVLDNGLRHFDELINLCAVKKIFQAEADLAARKIQIVNEHRKAAHEAELSLLGTVSFKKSADDIGASAAGEPLFLAIQSVAAHNGILVAPLKPSSLGNTVDPTRLNEIVSHAAIRYRKVLLASDWWNRDCGPMLCSFEADHSPAALIPATGGGYHLWNPADKKQQAIRVDGNIAASLTPFAFTFYRPFPQRVVSIFECLVQALAGARADILYILFMSILMAALSSLVPYITGIIFDRAIPESDSSLLFYGFMALIISAFASSLWQYAQLFPKIRLENLVTRRFQSAVMDRMLSFPTSFFRQHDAGNLVERALSVSHIGNRIDDIAITSLLAIFSIIFQFFTMYYYCSPMVKWVVIAAVVNLLVMLPASIFLVRILRFQGEIKGKQTGFVLQTILGIAKLRVAGAEIRALKNWAEMYGVEKKLEYSAGRLNNFFSCFQGITQMVCNAVIFYQAYLIFYPATPSAEASAGFTLGGFLAFNAASGIFMSSVTDLGSSIIGSVDILPALERIGPIMQTAPEIREMKSDPGELCGSVELSRVSFRYCSDGPLVLNDLSLSIKQGEFVAIVGSSGSGKSTLFRQLLGFETPEGGSILFDSRNLADLDIAAVRRQIGVVLQSGRIAGGSIFELIAGNGGNTLDDAWEAAAAAGFKDDIEAMPMQMHTVIGDGGTTLSGGQRQRLLIARALIKKPRIILLDEATSALDNRTQAIVAESLEKMRATRIVIAHRLSTIKGADRIFVLKDGKVAETGNFEELMALNGLFTNLARRQLA